MLTEKPWKPEAVLKLGLGILICLCVGMVILTSLGQVLPGLTKSTKDLAVFVIGAAFFQGAALVWIQLFLNSHNTGWDEAFGFSVGSLTHVVMVAFLAMAVVVPAAFLLGKISEVALTQMGIKVDAQLAVKMLQNRPPPGHLVVYGLGAILVAPVSEEMLFRGILYPTLKRSGHPQLALWVTSLLFASTHANLMALVPLTFLALVLTWLYERTGNLLAPILNHVLFNAVNFALLVIQPSWINMK